MKVVNNESEWYSEEDQNMATYYVAKANPTARAFVVRAENLSSAWIVLHESNSYAKACALRDAANGAS